MPEAVKRVEITLPTSSFELIQEAAQRRGLSVCEFVAAIAYDAALADKRALSAPSSRTEIFVVASESGSVFAQS